MILFGILGLMSGLRSSGREKEGSKIATGDVAKSERGEEKKNDDEGERLFGKVQMRLYRRRVMPLGDLVRQAGRALEVRRL